jgi:hypothetical protein
MSSYLPYATDGIGKVGIDLIHDTQAWLNVMPDDYNRYPQINIVNALNAGASRFVRLTKCITMPALMVMSANVQNYALPHSCLRILSARYYYGSDRQSYQELEILTDQRRMQMEDSVFFGDTGSPACYLYPSYKNSDLVQFGISPYPEVNGTAFVAANSGVTALNAGVYPSTIPTTPWGLAIDTTAGTCEVISTALGTIGDITFFTDQMALDVVRRPIPYTVNNLSNLSEIPFDYQDAITAWAVWVLGRANYNGLVQDAKAKDAKAIFDGYVAQYLEDTDEEETASEVLSVNWLA